MNETDTFKVAETRPHPNQTALLRADSVCWHPEGEPVRWDVLELRDYLDGELVRTRAYAKSGTGTWWRIGYLDGIGFGVPFLKAGESQVEEVEKFLDCRDPWWRLDSEDYE